MLSMGCLHMSFCLQHIDPPMCVSFHVVGMVRVLLISSSMIHDVGDGVATQILCVANLLWEIFLCHPFVH